MKKLIPNPDRSTWASLCQRPEIEKDALEASVKRILQQVKNEGDIALKALTLLFDGVQLNEIAVSPETIQASESQVSEALKSAMRTAKKNIETFHSAQLEAENRIETQPGVTCWRRSVAIDKVGLYIPGGTAPLFSSLLMLAVPAKLAGCREIVLCTPPGKDGKIHPAILYAASLAGVDQIFPIGGAQAIAAMAYGTESIPQVYKIFGPGNQYVTRAKELVQLEGTAIDMPAGPSEVLVIADETGNPAFIAADLLSQAEHGPDSQCIFLGTDQSLMEATLVELNNQLAQLPRRVIAQKALENSLAILLPDLETCLDFSNEYAPEHLIIASERAADTIGLIRNAGSVFLGNYSCESAGDYASGTNHTLPTNGYARNYSGVSLDSFVKKITFQELTAEGIRTLGPAIEVMAEAEELFAHKNAVTLRLQSL